MSRKPHCLEKGIILPVPGNSGRMKTSQNHSTSSLAASTFHPYWMGQILKWDSWHFILIGGDRFSNETLGWRFMLTKLKPSEVHTIRQEMSSCTRGAVFIALRILGDVRSNIKKKDTTCNDSGKLQEWLMVCPQCQCQGPAKDLPKGASPRLGSAERAGLTWKGKFQKPEPSGLSLPRRRMWDRLFYT